MSRPVILITGAAGGVGSALWPSFAQDFDLRLFDVVRVGDLPDGVSGVVGDITDRADLRSAMEGADAVVHLAGDRRTIATWPELTGPNLVGLHTVVETAAEVGVPRVVLASSCHASGRYDVERVPRVDPAWVARPCCRYGATKAYGETVGRFYAETSGLQVIALRLGAVAPLPIGPMGVAFWLSLDDLYRVFAGALRTTAGFGIYYAGSANVRDRWNLEPGERDLGFYPQDDSADHLAGVDFSLGVQPCYRGAL